MQLRIVAMIGLLMALAAPLRADQRIYGMCTQGGSKVSTGGILSQTTVDQVMPSCTVSVFNTGTTNLTTIYSDNNRTTKGNPFTAGADGSWFFYLPTTARVDVQLSGGTTPNVYSTPVTLGDILAVDPILPTVSACTVAFSATPVFTANSCSFFRMTLTGNVTSSTITGSQAGQTAIFQLCQDATGGRTFVWPTSFLRGPSPVAGSLAGNTCTDQSFVFDGTNWRHTATGDTSEVNSLIWTGSLIDGTDIPAASGELRLGSDGQVCWRNVANTADVCMAKNASDQITFPSVVFSVLSGTRIADQFVTLQAAISDACNASPVAPVYVPPGTFVQNSQFTLCDHLYIKGAGRATADQTTCPTTITTNQTTGDLFNVTSLDHVHIEGLCIVNNGAGGGTAIHLVGGRFGLYNDLYISGPWAQGIVVSPNVGVRSSIWNTFRNIHHTGYGANAAMVTLDALNTASQVINNNRFELMTGNGGTNGFGLKLKATGGTCPGSATFINENYWSGGQMSATTGTGLSADNCTFRDLYVNTATIEGNNLGVSIGTGNSGFTCIACEDSANTTNTITDNSGTSGRTFFTGNIGGAAQNFGVDPTGNIRANGLALDAAGFSAGNINGSSPMAIQVAGNGAINVQTSQISFGQPLNGFNFNAPMIEVNGTAAGSGTLRLASGDKICWRNPGNSADICLTAIQNLNSVTGCATAASVGATCGTTVTWPSAFVDTAYTVSCSGNAITSGVPFIQSVLSKTTTSVSVVTAALTAAAAQFTTIECMAMHP